MKLSKRALNIKESPTMAISSKAKAMKERGFDIIDFGVGEPDFETPPNIKEAGINAIKDGFTKYTAVGGTNELKDAIIEKFKMDNDLEYTRGEILVSCGGKHSIFNLCMAMFDAGDEVLIPAPYWVSYPEMVSLAGAEPIIIPSREESDFKITAGDINEYISPSTKAIIINSPSNPTGAVYEPSELKLIADVCLKKGIFIISDEIYEKLVYDSSSFVSVASFSEAVKKQTIVLNGVSKTYSMTGWRIGYAAGPKELIKAMADIQSQSTSSPCSISQKAAAAALTGSQDSVEKMAAEFNDRRNVMVSGLNSIKGIKCIMPKGAFYVFPNIRRLLNKRFGDMVIKTSADMADFLLEQAEVAVVPGDAFGGWNYMRLSYATSLENIKEGLKRIGEAVLKLE